MGRNIACCFDCRPGNFGIQMADASRMTTLFLIKPLYQQKIRNRAHKSLFHNYWPSFTIFGFTTFWYCISQKWSYVGIQYSLESTTNSLPLPNPFIVLCCESAAWAKFCYSLIKWSRTCPIRILRLYWNMPKRWRDYWMPEFGEDS